MRTAAQQVSGVLDRAAANPASLRSELEPRICHAAQRDARDSAPVRDRLKAHQSGNCDPRFDTNARLWETVVLVFAIGEEVVIHARPARKQYLDPLP